MAFDFEDIIVPGEEETEEEEAEDAGSDKYNFSKDIDDIFDSNKTGQTKSTQSAKSPFTTFQESVKKSSSTTKPIQKPAPSNDANALCTEMTRLYRSITALNGDMIKIIKLRETIINGKAHYLKQAENAYDVIISKATDSSMADMQRKAMEATLKKALASLNRWKDGLYVIERFDKIHEATISYEKLVADYETVSKMPNLTTEQQQSADNIKKYISSTNNTLNIAGLSTIPLPEDAWKVCGYLEGIENEFNNQYQEKLGELDNVLSELQSNRDIEKYARQMGRTVRMTQQREQAVRDSLRILETNSQIGGVVALKNLSTVIFKCIETEWGTLDRVDTFGVDAGQGIHINNTPLKIDSNLFSEDQTSLDFCPADREAIVDGRWGGCIDFRDLKTCRHLRVLDLSKAPENIIRSARREFGIVRGKWGKLFKTFRALEIIKLPEGDVTWDTQGLWNKFKSEKEYEKATANTRPENTKGVDVGSALATVKGVVWDKPLPRALIKTLGYGWGVPAYMGMMAALGPFGILMGALGVGALAHQEVKSYKEKGHL